MGEEAFAENDHTPTGVRSVPTPAQGQSQIEAIKHAARAQALREIRDELPRAVADAAANLVRAHILREDIAKMSGQSMCGHLSEWLDRAALKETQAAARALAGLSSPGVDQDARPDEPGGRRDDDVHDP